MEGRIAAYVVVINSTIETSKVIMKDRNVFLPSQKEEAFAFAKEKKDEGYHISFETLIFRFPEENKNIELSNLD